MESARAGKQGGDEVLVRPDRPHDHPAPHAHRDRAAPTLTHDATPALRRPSRSAESSASGGAVATLSLATNATS